jgi:RNA polymerase sigma-70 factor, ECF subfamily
MAELSDSDLMVKFQQGNPEAFALLFETYRGPVFNFIYRMLNSQKDAADDLLQEIFMKVIKAKDYYEPRAKFSTWLFSIARNHCINYLRSRRYAQGASTVSLNAEGSDGVSLMDVLPDRHPATSGIEHDEAQARLEQCIATLPDELKEVFLLRAVEGLPHTDVARILRLNPATVRTHYHRARLALQKMLGRLPAPSTHGIAKEERS